MKIFIVYSILALIVVLLTGSIYNNIPSSLETPLIKLSILGSSFFDKPSPSDWIKEEQIKIYSDKIIIFVPNATLSRYAPTKSMDPSLDETTNGLSIKPKNPEQLKVGDIISYSPSENSEYLIIHRIIETGYDKYGWFAITKGDNALYSDGKIRFEQIVSVTIILIY